MKAMGGNLVVMRRLVRWQLGGWEEDHKTKVMVGSAITIKRLGWWWQLGGWKDDHNTIVMAGML